MAGVPANMERVWPEFLQICIECGWSSCKSIQQMRECGQSSGKSGQSVARVPANLYNNERVQQEFLQICTTMRECGRCSCKSVQSVARVLANLYRVWPEFLQICVESVGNSEEF